MFTSQLTPYPSTHMPKKSPHGAFSSGTVTWPLPASLSKKPRSASSSSASPLIETECWFVLGT
jgi:hypothetical protein